MSADKGVILAHTSHSRAAIVHACRSDSLAPQSWLFLGRGFRVALLWERRLGTNFQRVDIGRALQHAADRLREPFVAWLDRLSERYGSDRHWWCSQLAERNTLLSPLFLHVCYLAVAEARLKERSHPVLIVADSWGVIEALRRLSLAQGLSVCVATARPRSIARLANLARVLGAAAYFVAEAIRNQAAARASRRGRAQRPFPAGRKRLMLATFFHESNLSRDGHFEDRYFPHLHEWLADQGFEVWVLPTVADKRGKLADKYEWMRRSSARFLIPEDWLGLSDYLDALVCGFKAWLRPREVGPLAGLDVRPLIAEERERQGGGNAARRACLISRIPARLRRAGFSPEQIINWSENQADDKALTIGCRGAFPNAAMTAVQNTPLPSNLLNVFPTAVEVAHRVVPERLVCSGPLPARILASSSGGALRPRVGCGLRYAYLWRQPLANSGVPRHDGSLVALLALPNTLSEAAELLDLALAASPSASSVAWYVKPHPDYSVGQLKPLIPPEALGRIQFATGRLGDWIGRIDVVVISGSGVALEAASLGVPVIFAASGTALTYDPLVWFHGKVGEVCYTPAEIARALARVAALDTADRLALRQLGRDVLEAWFAPVTEDGLRQFIV